MNQNIQIPQKPEQWILFKIDWIYYFPWLECELVYSLEQNKWIEKMTCKFCKKYFDHLNQLIQSGKQIAKPQSSSFINGTFSIKKQRCQEHLDAHEEFHKQSEHFCINNEHLVTKKQKDKQGYEQLFGFQKLMISEKLMVPLFATAYLIAKEDFDIQKYQNIITNLLGYLKVQMNDHYQNRKSCDQILEYLYQVISSNLVKDIKQQQFASISVDITCCQMKKQEVMGIAVRYIDNSFQVQEKYLSIKQLKVLNSQSYYQSLKEKLCELGLYEMIYFLCTDRAPVVASDKNGLSGLFKKDIPHLQQNHCIAHRACLGIKDLSNEFIEIKQLNHQIYSLCSYLNTMKRLNLLEINQQNLLKDEEGEKFLV